MGRMWVAKQNNKWERPATKQGIKTVLSKCTIAVCFFFNQIMQHSSLTLLWVWRTFTLLMNFFSVLLEQFSKCITLITIPLPKCIYKSVRISRTFWTFPKNHHYKRFLKIWFTLVIQRFVLQLGYLWGEKEKVEWATETFIITLR